jgi:hypothetical protein
MHITFNWQSGDFFVVWYLNILQPFTQKWEFKILTATTKSFIVFHRELLKNLCVGIIFYAILVYLIELLFSAFQFALCVFLSSSYENEGSGV